MDFWIKWATWLRNIPSFHNKYSARMSLPPWECSLRLFSVRAKTGESFNTSVNNINIRHIIFLLQLNHWCLRQRNTYRTECQNTEIRISSTYRQLKFKEYSYWRPAQNSRCRWCWSKFILFLTEMNAVYQKESVAVTEASSPLKYLQN